MNDFEQKQRWLASFIAALLFLIISSPSMYKVVSVILNKLMTIPATAIADGQGFPTGLGLLLHTIVFFLIIRAVMEIPMKKDNEKNTA